MLPIDEIQRARRFLFLKDQQRFIICHGTLRQILSRYINVHPDHIHFRYNENGKPYIAPNQNPQDFQFNLSHSGDLALVGIAKGAEIGVDVEEMKKINMMDDIVTRYGTHEEIKKYSAIPKMYKIKYFYKWFTRKESYVKAIGKGLSKIFETADAAKDHVYESLLLYNTTAQYLTTVCVNRKRLRFTK